MAFFAFFLVVLFLVALLLRYAWSITQRKQTEPTELFKKLQRRYIIIFLVSMGKSGHFSVRGNFHQCDSRSFIHSQERIGYRDLTSTRCTRRTVSRRATSQFCSSQASYRAFCSVRSSALLLINCKYREGSHVSPF